MYLRLGADGEAEEEDPGGGDAGLNRVRYRYRLLLHVFRLEHDLRISPTGFDEDATELGRTLDLANVPKREKAEALAAFAAHKDEAQPATSRAANAAETSCVPDQTISPVEGERDASVARQRNRCRCGLLTQTGRKERIMRYVFALLSVVSAWGIMPASAQECEPEVSLASLKDTYTVGSAPHRAEPDRNTAIVKEGEFESPEMITAIESNREDRERTVVIDR